MKELFTPYVQRYIGFGHYRHLPPSLHPKKNKVERSSLIKPLFTQL